MPTAIIGNKNSGKSTFTALLYESVKRFSNEPEFMNLFRFYSPPAKLHTIIEINQPLHSSKWPDKDENINPIVFKFAFRTNPMAEDFSIMDFGVYDIACEDISTALHGPTAEEFPSSVRNILGCRSLVLLINSDIFTGEDRRIMRYDSDIANLISLWADIHNKNHPRERYALYPTFFITKFDTLFTGNKVKALSEHDIESFAKIDVRERNIILERLLLDFMPQTMAILRGGQLMGTHINNTNYFYSYISESCEGRGYSPKTNVKNGQVLIDYSYEEYRRFILHYRDLAGEIPDDIVAIGEMGQ